MIGRRYATHGGIFEIITEYGYDYGWYLKSVTKNIHGIGGIDSKLTSPYTKHLYGQERE